MRTRVWTITCPTCKTEFYSRAQHDFRACQCGESFVDGGFSGYVRYAGKDLDTLRKSFRYRFIPVSQRELYEDWNRRVDQFGIITTTRKKKC